MMKLHSTAKSTSPAGSSRVASLKEPLIYGFTWLAWGSVAWSQINAYKLAFSLAVCLHLGTSIFTLAALLPKAAANSGFKLDSYGFSKAVETLKANVVADQRFVMLAVLDFTKLLLSLVILKSTS